MPGMAYGIVKDGLSTIGCVGYKQLVPNNQNTTIDTLYDIASLTKVVVVVPIISKLIDNKIIDFKDSVQKYLKSFKYNDITIYDLLTHTSGLPADLEGKDIISKEETLKRVYAAEKEYQTGTKVVYSDLGYILLGEIIEQIYNKPLDIVAKEEVFEPLDMKNTCYKPQDKDLCAPTEVTVKRGIVKGIVHDEKVCSLNQVSGSAGVFTNVNDISKFLSMILNDGIYNGKKFLSKEIVDLWFKPLVYEEKNNRFRSLCWIVGVNNFVINKGENVISFSGFTGPSISIDRDNKIAISLLTNRVHPSRYNRLLIEERPKITDFIYKKLVKTNKYSK